jgi:hypothetical protein
MYTACHCAIGIRRKDLALFPFKFFKKFSCELHNASHSKHTPQFIIDCMYLAVGSYTKKLLATYEISHMYTIYVCTFLGLSLLRKIKKSLFYLHSDHPSKLLLSISIRCLENVRQIACFRLRQSA